MGKRRPDPDWGQSMRNMGSAGGKHTKGNQTGEPGCLDSIIAVGMLGAAAVTEGVRLLT